MCCSSSRTCDTKWVAGFTMRVAFGLSLIFIGLIHYRQMNEYSAMVSSNLGPLTQLAEAWAYVLPGLFLLGGFIFVLGMFQSLAAWLVGIALGSIAAGMLLKTLITSGAVQGATLGETMPATANAFIWLIVYAFVIKFSSCSSCGPCGSCDSHGNAAMNGCDCGKPKVTTAPALKTSAAKVKKTMSK